MCIREERWFLLVAIITPTVIATGFPGGGGGVMCVRNMNYSVASDDEVSKHVSAIKVSGCKVCKHNV